MSRLIIPESAREAPQTNRPVGDSCANCRAWEKDPEQGPNIGTCRRTSPSPIPVVMQHKISGERTQGFQAVWPGTDGTEYCFDHIPLPNSVSPAKGG